MAEPAEDRSVEITLPDGSRRRYAGPVTGAAIAADIGPGLAKAALALRVDGTILDLAATIHRDAAISIITRSDDDETVLPLLRHDAAHVLAEAVQELYPGTQITFGPAIDNGFFYDFSPFLLAYFIFYSFQNFIRNIFNPH